MSALRGAFAPNTTLMFFVRTNYINENHSSCACCHPTTVTRLKQITTQRSQRDDDESTGYEYKDFRRLAGDLMNSLDLSYIMKYAY